MRSKHFSLEEMSFLEGGTILKQLREGGNDIFTHVDPHGQQEVKRGDPEKGRSGT